MSFGKRLSSLRKEKGFTQKDLANLLEISRGTIGMYEIGKRDPDTNTLHKISNIFDVSIDYLLCKTDVKNYNQKETVLNKKDKKEIEKILEETEKILLEGEGLMFNGEPATEEAVQSIIDAMRVGMEIAKKRNKEKYTPKKYK